MRPNSKIAVITPTTGRPELRKCAESIARQTIKGIQHIVVVDGIERRAAALKHLSGIDPRPDIIELKYASGLNGYNGHRIYGALPYLLNANWIAYLDEDNWFDSNHFEMLAKLALNNDLSWAYALRKIVDWTGKFICNDNCNSLGWWPSFDGGYNHIDTNCYFMRREIAVQLSSTWHRRSGMAQVESADRALCMRLLRDFPAGFTSGEYSVNYRIGSRDSGHKARTFYEGGNRIMASIYRIFPWASTNIAGRLKEHPCLAWKVGSKDKDLKEIYDKLWSYSSPLGTHISKRKASAGTAFGLDL